MRTIFKSFEPLFGGIVAAMATAFLCLVLYASANKEATGGTGGLIGYCTAAIGWGLLQIYGYRDARRNNLPLAEPVLGGALGCVLAGLLLAIVTVVYDEFGGKPVYSFVLGIAAAVFLIAGAVVGVRQGVWKNN